jgi:hypothetical protein
MNSGISLSGLSLSRAYSAGRSFPEQHRVYRPDEEGSIAGFDVNQWKDALAKSTTNALVTASSSVKRVLSILSDRRPGGGARQSKDTTWLSEEGYPAKACPSSIPSTFWPMTAEDILQYCADHACDLQTNEAMAMVHRLYDIALFEHDIEEERAKKALEWIEVLKRDINATSMRDNKSLSQFEEECTSAIETASRFGRGSLLWKLVEDRVPDAKIAEYLTRPEHGHLLQIYSYVTGLNRIQNMKPILIVNLVKQHLFPGVGDPVVSLHALAMGGAPAFAVLFDAAEIHAFINVPDDYDAARLALANAGVNVGRNPLCMLRNPRNLSAIPSIVNSIIVKRSQNDRSDTFLATSQTGAGDVLKLVLVCLRYNVARRILSQYYGPSTGDALFGLSTKSVQMGIERLDAAEAELSGIRCEPSINHRLIQEVIQYYCSDDVLTQVEGRNQIDVGAQFICVERAQFID